MPQSYRYDKQPAVAECTVIEYAALADNAAQWYIMIVSQLYAKGSLAICQRAFYAERVW